MRSLIVGDGYLATSLAQQLHHSGASVERASCCGPGKQEVDQVVLVPPFRGEHEQFVDRVDGPSWVMCSWAGAFFDSHAGAAERARRCEDAVLQRGGTLLHLSTVFGRGGDDNVTRIARCVRRYRALVGVGNGGRLLQPLHVDDLAALVGCHLRRPSSGCFEVAGPEAVPVAEVCQSIVEILGVRSISHAIAPLGRWLEACGTRSRVAVDWRDEHPPVDIHPARAQFGWSPLALGVRVEQAVHEALT